jgi:hypothetical protein
MQKRKRKAPRRGYVIWRGKSNLDGKRVVVIATLKTKNAKTGPMIQTWILRERISPVSAMNKGLDFSICGTCVHSANHAKKTTGNPNDRDCYVVGRAPQAVWKAWKRGRYPDISADAAAVAALGVGRTVRCGAYGDPVAVPVEVWKTLISRCIGHTSYTHQWSWAPGAQDFASFTVASVDSTLERYAAKAAGWRSFRAKLKGEPREKGESVCPASNEAGKLTTCHDCRRCDGHTNGRTLDIVIDLHGAKYSRKEVYSL